MSSAKQALIIHSPNSGRSAQFSEALAHLRNHDIQIVDTLPITSLNGISPQGKIWQQQGIDLVVAAGGDGLVGGVTAHVATSGLPMGILPLGTANDVARTVGIPIDIQQAAEVIVNGKPYSIDLGLAYPARKKVALRDKSSTIALKDDATQQAIYFAHALTVGINVQFARLATDPKLRRQYGSWTYPFAVLEAMRTYKPIEMEIHFEGLVVRETPEASPIMLSESIDLCCRCAQTTVVNAPIFWGPLQASVPGVSLNDRFLDIVIIEHSDINDLVMKTLRFFNRKTHRHARSSAWHAQYDQILHAELTDIPGIHHVQARGVTIATTKKPFAATLDGEVRGETPISARVADERLTLMVPTTFNQ